MELCQHDIPNVCEKLTFLSSRNNKRRSRDVCQNKCFNERESDGFMHFFFKRWNILSRIYLFEGIIIRFT